MIPSLQRYFSNLFQTQESLSPHDKETAFKMLVRDGVCSMSMAALQGGPILAAFALAIGASNYEIGLLGAIAFIAQPMQFLGLVLMKMFPARRAFTFFCTGTARLLWVFIILVPVLFVNRGSAFLIQWMVISALLAAVPGPAWNSLLHDIVPTEALGKVMSKRMATGTVAAMGLTLSAGFFVDWWKNLYPEAELYAYSVLFALGLAFGLAGLAAIRRLPEPAMVQHGTVPLSRLLAAPAQDKNYRTLLAFMATWSFAVNMASPFFVVYMLNRIGLSFSQVMVLTVVNQATHVLFLRLWGKLSDRHSNKSVLAISGPLFLIAVALWSFTTLPEKHAFTIPLLAVIHILSGAAVAGVNLSTANIALKLSPKGWAHSYMAVFGLAAATGGAAGPLIGGALADFFSLHELSLSLNWSSPHRALSVYALNLRALDFVFFAAFLAGMVAVKRLSRVREIGEVAEKEVINDLLNEIALPFRGISSVEGMMRTVFPPIDKLWTMKSPARESRGQETTRP